MLLDESVSSSRAKFVKRFIGEPASIRNSIGSSVGGLNNRIGIGVCDEVVTEVGSKVSIGVGGKGVSGRVGAGNAAIQALFDHIFIFYNE